MGRAVGPDLAQRYDWQSSILRHALKFPSLKRLVYSTCSVHVEENERVIEDVFKDVKDKFELAQAMPHWARRGLEGQDKCLRADPQLDLCTGFFVAVFERNLHIAAGRERYRTASGK